MVNLSQRIGKSSFYVLVSNNQSSKALDGTATDIDAVAVVSDLKQFQPSILDDNVERSRTSIHCILDQFFQSMNRGDNDFAGSNFVDNILIKSLDKSISGGSALGLLGTCYLDSLWSLGS